MVKVREFATRWDRPGDRTFFEREEAGLIGTARGVKGAIPKFRPFDMLAAPGEARVLWLNEDMRIGVRSHAGPPPPFRRHCDYDTLWVQFAGRTTVESEYGVFELVPAEMLHIPAGIAHRGLGDADSLSLFVELPEPLTINLSDKDYVGHTEFEVVRDGGPRWGASPAGAMSARVLEELTTWDDHPDELTVIERDRAELVGTATAGRGMFKLRAFDFFPEITGRRGPGPTIYESSVFRLEVFNTEGSQAGVHRGLDNDELWLQFGGESLNESELGNYLLGPGEMARVPPGIAHHVVGSKGMLRWTLYSRRRWRLAVDPHEHAFESRFAVRERVLSGPPWKREERRQEQEQFEAATARAGAR